MAAKAKRILFIDDDRALATIMKFMIEIIGHEVITVSRGSSAINLLKLNPERFDLVITDLNMPYMNGIELSKALLNIQPGLPIILCTGSRETVDEESTNESGIKKVLAKPFSIKELEATVNQVLA
jgi:DNA-binding response OmpR family regulator